LIVVAFQELIAVAGGEFFEALAAQLMQSSHVF
jgi:hypothetical protein